MVLRAFVSSAVEQLHNQPAIVRVDAFRKCPQAFLLYRFRVIHSLKCPCFIHSKQHRHCRRAALCPLLIEGIVALCQRIACRKACVHGKHNPTIFQFQLSQPKWRKNHVNPSVSPPLLLLAYHICLPFSREIQTEPSNEIFFQKVTSFLL